MAPRISALYEFEPDIKLIVEPSFTTDVLNTPALTETTVIVLYPYSGLIKGVSVIISSTNHPFLNATVVIVYAVSQYESGNVILFAIAVVYPDLTNADATAVES